ncbi:phosphatidylinositol glycan anchor biosynthesis class U protein [Folsomia candida]|uniref:phosphatidylinositol glycan anchor biosynthesis class U protein n=1 Tax=Folsomia candida TaxID=158441 RepID=UPI000B8FE4A1|nr:phosphatidylinositol glycan anchor biosynthesis class U protein [Folsomia candida]XP_021961861.1 phosphatidylinositol glycan anchor biosynthesis class U protein [Folsomia candida]
MGRTIIKTWTYCAGFAVRLCLFLTNFHHVFHQRIEVSTPLNSWLRVQEGLYLMRKGISPYTGDTFHETPVALLIADYLVKLPELLICLVFILCDLLTAVALASGVEEAKRFYFIKSQKTSKYIHSEDTKHLKIEEKENYGELVIMSYLLNPFTIVNCVGQTTTVFGNLVMAVSILSMLKGYRLLTGISLALCTYQSLYPVSLIFPAIISIYNKESETEGSKKKSTFTTSAVKTVLSFLIPFLSLMYISHFVTNDWGFLDSTFGFILNVRDLKPNIGLFWYFFTEMFGHFHLLFICTFQINAFIYMIPLTIRFFNEPSILIYSFCALMSIFKSYPCIGDVGFYLALLPMWKHLFPFMQQKFLVGCFFIATSVLAPIQWFLWIYSGSANANFYFGVTIAFGTAQIFLLTDVLLAYMKREYYLCHGMKKEIDGKPAGLSLQ